MTKEELIGYMIQLEKLFGEYAIIVNQSAEESVAQEFRRQGRNTKNVFYSALRKVREFPMNNREHEKMAGILMGFIISDIIFENEDGE